MLVMIHRLLLPKKLPRVRVITTAPPRCSIRARYSLVLEFHLNLPFVWFEFDYDSFSPHSQERDFGIGDAYGNDLDNGL